MDEPILVKTRCNVCKKNKDAKKDFRTMHSHEVNGGYVYVDKTCKSCRLKRRRMNKKRGIDSRSEMYVCIYDPSNTYRDSHLHWGAIKLSMSFGNIPPGSIWMNRKSGVKYRIVGNEAYHYLYDCLTDVSKIPDDIIEQQRRVLVRNNC